MYVSQGQVQAFVINRACCNEGVANHYQMQDDNTYAAIRIDANNAVLVTAGTGRVQRHAR